MYTLFIDTHATQVLVVLYKDGEVTHFKAEDSPQSHCTYSMKTIHALLTDANITINDINEIIVVIGPGSFTGVRIGVTIAKTFAHSLKVPIKVIDTLTMYAISNNEGSGKLIALEDTKGFYYGMFNHLGDSMWDLAYLEREEFNKFIKEKKLERMLLKDNLQINLDNVFEYLKNKGALNPHEVNPFYVKPAKIDND